MAEPAHAASTPHARRSIGLAPARRPADPVPIILFLLIGFAAPLLAVIGFSFMPPRTFGLWQTPTLENYADRLQQHQLHLLPLVAGPRGADGRSCWR